MTENGINPEMKNAKLFLRDPRAQIAYILILIWIINFIRKPQLNRFYIPLIPVIILVFLDVAFTYIKNKKLYYPFSSVVTGLLIGLVISPVNGLLPVSVAGLIAFFSKQFLKFKKRHIFNPAALGIIITSVIFGIPVSWWSVASGGIIIILILFSVPILYRLGRLQYSLIFLLGYFINYLITQGVSQAVTLTLDGTVFLFTFIMMTEPMTSAIAGKWKYIFGFLVLVLILTMTNIHFSPLDPFLSSLLVINLVTRIFTG